jgi:hypothetical protein
MTFTKSDIRACAAVRCLTRAADVIGPRDSCAAKPAGSSHAVIDGENAPSE